MIIWNNTISACKLWNTDVNNIYLWNSEIYSSNDFWTDLWDFIHWKWSYWFSNSKSIWLLDNMYIFCTQASNTQANYFNTITKTLNNIASIPSWQSYPWLSQYWWNMYLAWWYNAGYLTTFRRYNVSSNTWTELSNMPTAAERTVSINVWNYIYVFWWKIDWLWNTTTVSRRYDIALNSWDTVSSMPYWVKDANIWYYDWKIYIFWWDSNNNRVQVYNISWNSWTTLAETIPYWLSSMWWWQIWSNMYIVNWYNWDEKNRIFDFITETWTLWKQCPIETQYSAVVNDKLYIHRSFDSTTDFVSIYKYTP